MIARNDPVHILFVCTANRCRSPIAESIARFELTRRTVPGTATSAGFLGGDHPPAVNSVRVCAQRGLDISQHRSVQVTPGILRKADVILTMEGSHVIDLHGIEPEASRRAMPLLLAAARATSEPLVGHLGPDDLRSWVGEHPRHLQQLLQADLDLTDPIDRSRRRFRKTADQIEAAIREVFDAWFGKPPT